MDPSACYCDMLISMQNGDFETARGHALQLKRWLDGGGYYPLDENMLEVQATGK